MTIFEGKENCGQKLFENVDKMSSNLSAYNSSGNYKNKIGVPADFSKILKKHLDTSRILILPKN